MKLRFLIVPAMMATALIAQDPSPRRGVATGTHTFTPPTPAQLAANQLTMIARYLRLDSTQTSALLADKALAGDIENEQATLQANATKLKTDITALNAAIVAAPKATPDVSAINTLNALNLAAKAQLAGGVLSEIETNSSLGITLTAAQKTGIANLILGGGFGGGFGGPRGGFGPPPGGH